MKLVRQLIKLYILQSVLYFISKLLESNPICLNNSIDESIPFISLFVYFYISWYILMIIVPYLLFKHNKKVYNNYISKCFMCYIICFIIYIIFPTTVNRSEFIVNDLSSFLVRIIYYLDTPIYNCFPSIHCILSFIFIYSIFSIKVPNIDKILIIIMSIMIIISTLFIKQHVLLDVLGGFIVSLIWFIPTSSIDDKILKIIN